MIRASDNQVVRRFPGLAADVSASSSAFVEESGEDAMGRARKVQALSRILRDRPNVPARAIDGVAYFVDQAEDIDRRQIRINHVVQVLHDNPAISGQDFLDASHATRGSFSQTEAAARLREKVAELQARSLAATQVAPSGGGPSTSGVTMEMLRKLEDDPVMRLASQAATATSARLSHYHDALDRDRDALFGSEHALYAMYKNLESNRHGLAATAVGVGIALGGLSLSSVPMLPATLHFPIFVAGLAIGLAAGVITHRTRMKQVPAAVEKHMREVLEPQRDWWKTQQKELQPFCVDLRNQTLQRIWSESPEQPAQPPGQVVVGDGAIQIGGVRVERRGQ